MKIRIASDRDAEAISVLTRELSSKYISPHLAPAAQKYLHDALSADQVLKNIRVDCRYHVCEEAGTIIGVIAMRANRHLLKLFVADAFHGRGVARALWGCAKETCIDAGNTAPFTVNAAVGAEPLYQKFGFVRSGAPTFEEGITRVPMHLTISD